jgi:hypothetical protein
MKKVDNILLIAIWTINLIMLAIIVATTPEIKYKIVMGISMINAINTIVRAVRSEMGNSEFIFEMVCGVILVLILSFIIIR